MGEAAAIAAALAWAMASLVMKQLSGRYPALPLGAWRCLFASLFFVVIFAPAGRVHDVASFPLSALAALVGSALVGIVLGDTNYIRALRFAPLAVVYPISMTLYPLFAVILATSFLNESLGWPFALGTALVLAGVAAIAFSRPSPAAAGELALGGEALQSERLRLGLGLAIFSALCWGGSTIVLKLALEDVDVIAANTLRLPIIAGFLVGLSLRQLPALHPRAFGRSLWLVALEGVLDFGAGSLLFLYAITKAGAGLTAVLSSVSPLFAMPLTALVFKERVTKRMIAGTVLCLAGIVVISAA